MGAPAFMDADATARAAPPGEAARTSQPDGGAVTASLKMTSMASGPAKRAVTADGGVRSIAGSDAAVMSCCVSVARFGSSSVSSAVITKESGPSASPAPITNECVHDLPAEPATGVIASCAPTSISSRPPAGTYATRGVAPVPNGESSATRSSSVENAGDCGETMATGAVLTSQSSACVVPVTGSPNVTRISPSETVLAVNRAGASGVASTVMFGTSAPPARSTAAPTTCLTDGVEADESVATWSMSRPTVPPGRPTAPRVAEARGLPAASSAKTLCEASASPSSSDTRHASAEIDPVNSMPGAPSVTSVVVGLVVSAASVGPAGVARAATCAGSTATPAESATPAGTEIACAAPSSAGFVESMTTGLARSVEASTAPIVRRRPAPAASRTVHAAACADSTETVSVNSTATPVLPTNSAETVRGAMASSMATAPLVRI